MLKLETDLNTTIETGIAEATTTAAPASAVTASADAPATGTPDNDAGRGAGDVDVVDACSCDLQSGNCDANCCCDGDCSADDVQLFNGCWTPADAPFGRRYCRNGTRADLLCIARDNVRKRHAYGDAATAAAQTAAQISLIETSQYPRRWTNVPTAGQEVAGSASVYVQGSAVFTVDLRDGRIGHLQLPAALNSRHCLVASDVRFLRPSSQTCAFHLKRASDCPTANSMAVPADPFKVFQRPRFVTNAADQTTVDWSLQSNDSLVPVVARRCASHGGQCRQLGDLHTLLPRPSLAVGAGVQDLCTDVVRSLTYRIFYNGTRGITKIYADFQLGNVSIATRQGGGGGGGRGVEFVVQFGAVFQSVSRPVGQSDPKVFVKSGNPGYLVGRPLLTRRASLMTDSDSDSESFDGLAEIFPAPSGCARRRLVKFGENRLDFCQSSFELAANDTQFCAKWTAFVVDQLLADQRAFAVWANASVHRMTANVSDANAWVAVKVVTPADGGLLCASRSVESQTYFIYRRVGPVEAAQNQLVGVRVQLRSGQSPSPADVCRRSPCRLLISNAVSFVDSSAPSTTLLPVPPSLKIRLPHDFFYPFRLASSSSSSSSFSIVQHLISLSVCFSCSLLYSSNQFF